MPDVMGFLAEELAGLAGQGLLRPLRVLEGPQGARISLAGREVIELSSDNYLGLAGHPSLKAAARAATDCYGVGSGAVRTSTGTQEIHEELERALAEFKKTEACLVFQSGFAANLGVIPALVGEGDLIISDALNHASIVDGCRLARADRRIYAHKDLNALRAELSRGRQENRRRLLVVTEGVFGLDGEIAPLPGLVELAEEYGAMVMVDDAHASGVLGEYGRGSIDHFCLHGRVQIQVGTLAKALGVLGGYVAGSADLRRLLIHRARPFLFSTSHPPMVAAACLAALDVLQNEPERLARLWENTRYFQGQLQALGFAIGVAETPITPIMVGRTDLAVAFSDRLLERGVLAQGIGHPAVPEGKARLRAMVTAEHSRAELDWALTAIGEVGRELGLISRTSPD